MTYTIMASLSMGLLVLCIANLYFSIDILFNQDEKSEDPFFREKQMFARGVSCVCVFMLLSCVSWLLWDWDLISKIAQYKIGILGRFFAIAGAFMFYLTLSLGLPRKKKAGIILLAILSAATVYIFKVLA